MKCTKCGADYYGQYCPNCGASNTDANSQANNYSSYGAGVGFGSSVEKRSIATCIILTIITCGIYGLIWIVRLNDDTNAVASETNATSGGMVILLSFITCGIYLLYWNYKQGEKLNNARRMRGLPEKFGALYLLLSIFGLTIVGLALMQDELNSL